MSTAPLWTAFKPCSNNTNCERSLHCKNQSTIIWWWTLVDSENCHCDASIQPWKGGGDVTFIKLIFKYNRWDWRTCVHSELKTYESDILNPDRLIKISTVETFCSSFWISLLDCDQCELSHWLRAQNIKISLRSDWLFEFSNWHFHWLNFIYFVGYKLKKKINLAIIMHWSRYPRFISFQLSAAVFRSLVTFIFSLFDKIFNNGDYIRLKCFSAVFFSFYISCLV